MPSHQLTRRYIAKRLSEYYAQPADRVVGVSAATQNANLSALMGQWHWRRVLSRYYEEREGHWLTPVELFQPYFSQILADFCCQAFQVQEQGKVDIVELGGGRGTNAKLILSYLQEHKPEIYENVTYTIVDSSPSLHKLQRSVFEDIHTDKVRFQLQDLLDVAEKRAELLTKSNIPTAVIAMEVLDNLPHDKVNRANRKIEQSEFRETTHGPVKEVFQPLNDPLLSKIVQRVPSFVKPYPVWIPSVACGVLDHIIAQRPNLSLVFADFDWLPAPDLEENDLDRLSIWAEGEPIITDMEGQDHECYLQAPPHCDILFPTDFEKLASYARRALQEDNLTQSTVHVEKQSEFLERHGSQHIAKTKSWLTGHTPLLHDFANCSVLSLTPSGSSS